MNRTEPPRENVIEHHLEEALASAEDDEVRYHVRQALQLVVE